MCPGPRPTSISSDILIHPAVWSQQTWAENWETVPLFGEGELGPHLAQCGMGRGLPPCQVASSSIQPFGHNRHGPKIGGGALPPFWGRGAGSPSNTMSLGSRPTSIPSGVLIHPAVWPQLTWAKNWGLCPFGGGGVESPCNTMWPRPRPTSVPSFILIHAAVWPQ